MPTLGEVTAAVADLAPPQLAETWDNVGLQVGDPEAAVAQVVTALEISPAVLAEAISLKADAIVCHHPLILEPIARLTPDDPAVRTALELHANGIGLVVAHTNLDNSPRGPSAVLTEQLGLAEVQPFPVCSRERQLKIVVFVPEGSWRLVRDAMASAGAGSIGNYSHCSFRSPGVGTFLPLAGARPHIGEVGKVEEASELRLEMVVPESSLAAVTDAMTTAHPYEEVAHDLYALESPGPPSGFGRIGVTTETTTLGELAERVEALLSPEHLRVVGVRATSVDRVAVIAGSGGDHVAAAASAGADVLLTGDTKHHQAAEAVARGLCLLDPGHYETEKCTAATFADFLRRRFPDELSVAVAEDGRSPYAA